jgi:NAD(P)-dependent dehydrogenase (short-subunit alcohol dehydrogenase family)
MHDAGATVVITDLDRAGLDDAVSELGPRASGLIADVTDLVAMERTFEEVVGSHGRLDAVVANAGVGDSAPLGSITEQQFDFIFGVNVKGRSVHRAGRTAPPPARWDRRDHRVEREHPV